MGILILWWFLLQYEEVHGEEYWIIQGATTTSCWVWWDGCDARLADESEVKKIRCCADEDPGDWYKSGGCTVYAETDWDEICYTGTHSEAEQICANAGGRLCSREELEQQCTKGTGCNHDHYMIWTSTIGSPTNSPVPYPTAAGVNCETIVQEDCDGYDACIWWESYGLCVWTGYYIAEKSCSTGENDWTDHYDWHICIQECNANPACLAIEVQIDYGGPNNRAYLEPSRCRTQSRNAADCNGVTYNSDLWIKIPKNHQTASYIHMGDYCINNNDMNDFNKTVDQCAEICSLMDECLGFEYYDSSNNGSSIWNATCRPQTGVYDVDEPCSGSFSNLDYYLVEPDGFDLEGVDMNCGAGTTSETDLDSYSMELSNGEVWVWDRSIHGCAKLCDMMYETCNAFVVWGTFPQYDICTLWISLGVTSSTIHCICFSRESTVAPTLVPTTDDQYRLSHGYCDAIGCNVIQTYDQCVAAGLNFGQNGIDSTHDTGRLPGCFIHYGDASNMLEFNYNLDDDGNDFEDTSSICNCYSSVTLENGETESQGNVYVNGLPVCQTNWDMADGDVVCKQLGYSGAYKVYHHSHFGEVNESNFALDNVDCNGNETDILDCAAADTSITCYGINVAGVHCMDGTTYSPTVIPSDLPTEDPTSYPTVSPTMEPTHIPSPSPTYSPSMAPTLYPTMLFQIEWCVELTGLLESDLVDTRFPIGKAIGLDEQQVTIHSYDLALNDDYEESNNTWDVDYRFQVETMEVATLLIDYLSAWVETIEEVMKLELEADLENRIVNVTIIEQNITLLAFTDPPTSLPTLGPSVLPTLSPTRNEDLSPTEEPTGFPSRVPTRRPSYHPSNDPTSTPTDQIDIRGVSAVFDPTGLSIFVTFDTATSHPGDSNAFNCGNILDSATVNLLGTTFDEDGARCEWSSKLILAIYTGYQAVIMPGQNLTFLSGGTDATDCDDATICTEFQKYPIKGWNITVTASDIIEPVEVSLLGPAAIGFCQDLSITMTYSGGAGRDLIISWTIPEDLASYAGCNITLDEEILFVEASCIEGASMAPGTLDFEVQVQNWIGATDSETFTTYWSGTNIPDIALRGPNSITANPLDELEIPIDVDMPECAQASAYDFEFFWRQTHTPWTPSYFGWDSATEINTDSLALASAIMRKNLVISSGIMQYDSFYVFKLRVTGDGSVNDHNYIGIQTDRRPLAVAIYRDEQPLSTDQAVDISGLDLFQWSDLREANDWWESSDLDSDSESEAIQLLYDIVWTCNEVDVEDGVEVLSDCEPDPLTIWTSDFLTLSWNETLAETYFSDVGKVMRFSINVTDSYGRSASNNVNYVITQRKYPEVAISPSSVVISLGEMAILQVFVVSSDMSSQNGVVKDSLDADEILNRYSLTWATSDDSLEFEEGTGALTEYETSASIDSSAPGFSVGATYTIEVTVSPMGDYSFEGSVKSYATVRLNSPPSSGVCNMNLNEGIAYDTQFTFSCSNWADEDSPLKYSFSLLTIDQNTDEKTSSTPLINLSNLPSYTFPSGPGVFRVEVLIVDTNGAYTSFESDNIIISLDEEDQEFLESDPANFLSNLTASNGESFTAMANAGDLSGVAGAIAVLSATMDLIRDQTDIAATNSTMQDTRYKMSELLTSLLNNLIPTIDTFITLADMLKTVVREIDELGEDAVGDATETASHIIDEMITLLQGNLISYFPSTVVKSLMDSCTNMMIKGADLGLADDLSALFDAAQTTLLESLTDTLPGQNGFQKEDNLTKINAQRRTPDEISDASTEYADLPIFPQLDSISSADCVMRADTFDVYSNFTTLGDIVSVNLYDSSEQADSRRRRKGYRRRRYKRRRSEVVEINGTDECEPIILVISTTAFADPSAILGEGAPNVSNTTIEFPECISTPTSDPTAIGEQEYSNDGCTIIAWTNTTATCSCTHLSAFGSDMSEFLPDFSVFTDPGISDINLDSLAKNPMVVVMSFLLLFLMVRLIPLPDHKASDKHLLAHQFVWAERRYLLVKESAFHQEFKGKTHKNFWIRWSLLYRYSVRNKHPVFSIILRQTGTNFTAHQRIICVLSSLATCLAINAIFYGITFEAPATESATTIFVTIIATIVPMIGKLWFKKHRMSIHTSEKQEKLIEANKRLERINYYVGCYFCCYCCKERIYRKKKEKKEKLKVKMAAIKKRLLEHDSFKKGTSQSPGVKVAAIKKLWKSLKRTYSPHNHEDAYLFDDTKMEKKISRTVQIGWNDNPFLTFEDMFHFFDPDNSGVISRAAVEEVVAFLEQNYDKERNEELIQSLLIVDHQDELTYEEFKLCMSSYFQKRPLSWIFKHFDQDNSGYITRSEFQEALRSLGEDGSDENVDSLLRDLDLDGSGNLNKKEFTVAVKENRIRKRTTWRTAGETGESGEASVTAVDDPIILGFIESGAPQQQFQRANENLSARAKRVRRTIELDPQDLEYFAKREQEVGLYREEVLHSGRAFVFSPNKENTGNWTIKFGNMIPYNGIRGPQKHGTVVSLDDITDEVYGEGIATRELSTPGQSQKWKNQSGSVICQDDLYSTKDRKDIFTPSLDLNIESRSETHEASDPIGNTPGGDVKISHIYSIKRSTSLADTAGAGESDETELRVCRRTTIANSSSFMLQDSEFWISNRACLMVGSDISERDLRTVKNWEMKLLVEKQEEILRMTFKMPKKMFKFVWCCYLMWVIFTIGVIFVWGVNMDSDATDYPEDDLVDAATSNCDTRTTTTGEVLDVDVSADDALNLEGAQNTADETNENFERYNSIDMLAWIPDFDILPEEVPESYRFVTSSVSSWLMGTFFLPICNMVITAFLLAIIYRNDHGRLVDLLHNKDKLERTIIEDFDVDDKLFLICCWPEALIDLLSGKFPEEEKNKLKIHKSPIFERVLELIAKNVV